MLVQRPETAGLCAVISPPRPVHSRRITLPSRFDPDFCGSLQNCNTLLFLSFFFFFSFPFFCWVLIFSALFFVLPPLGDADMTNREVIRGFRINREINRGFQPTAPALLPAAEAQCRCCSSQHLSLRPGSARLCSAGSDILGCTCPSQAPSLRRGCPRCTPPHNFGPAHAPFQTSLPAEPRGPGERRQDRPRRPGMRDPEAVPSPTFPFPRGTHPQEGKELPLDAW